MSNTNLFKPILLGLTILFAVSVIQAQQSSQSSRLDGEYYIQSGLGDKYLDVKWGNAAAGTPLQIWEFNGSTAQKFKLIWAEPGFYYLQSNLGLFVYAEGNAKSSKAPVKIGRKNATDNFKWKLVDKGNGYYSIINKAVLYMDVQWGVSNNGTPVWMWDLTGTGAQLWKLKSTTAAATTNVVAFLLPQVDNKLPARINKGLWTTVFNATLSNIRIKINNFTPRDFEYTADNTFRWLKPNDSEFVIRDDKNPYRQVFNIEPFRQDPLTIYINDLNLSRATSSHENGHVKITMRFEEQGIEIVTNCVDNFGCGGIGNPNFHFENPVIEVLFKPIVNNGKITYRDADVRFSGHLSHVGVNLGVSLMQAVADLLNFDIDNEISKKGEAVLEGYLNDPGVIAAITAKLNAGLNTSSLAAFNVPATIQNVVIDNGGDLLIYGN